MEGEIQNVVGGEAPDAEAPKPSLPGHATSAPAGPPKTRSQVSDGGLKAATALFQRDEAKN